MESLFCLVFLQLQLDNNLVAESFHVLTAVYLRIPVFCDMTLRRWVPDVSKKPLTFIFKAKWFISIMDHLPLKIKEICSFEESVINHPKKQYHFPYDRNPHLNTFPLNCTLDMYVTSCHTFLLWLVYKNSKFSFITCPQNFYLIEIWVRIC